MEFALLSGQGAARERMIMGASSWTVAWYVVLLRHRVDAMYKENPPNCFRELQKRGYKFHVFVSWPHSIQRRGREIVEQLARGLEDRFRNHGGGEVFLDLERVKPGFKLSELIRRSLCRTGVGLFILVPSFFESEYCKTEWHIVESLQDGRLPEDAPHATCMVPMLLKTGIKLPEEMKDILRDDSMVKVLAYGGPPHEHPEWEPLIDRLVERIEETLSLMCRVSESAINWDEDESKAMHLGPKHFSWLRQEVPAAPRRARTLPALVAERSRL